MNSGRFWDEQMYRVCCKSRSNHWDETKMHIVDAFVLNNPQVPNVFRIQTMLFIGFKDSNGGQGIYLS